MVKEILKTIGKRLIINVQIGILAFLGASVLLIMIKNPQRFQASVLSLQEQKIIQEKDRDLAYKVQTGLLDVFLAKNPEDSSSQNISQNTKIYITISHIPNKITLQTGFQEAQTTYEILEYTGNEMHIAVRGYSGYDTTKSLFLVPFSGQNSEGRPQILVSEARREDTENNQQKIPFAIGNLGDAMQSTHAIK